MIGQTVSHYRIVEKLGQGGMGVVYRAEDTNLDRQVAIRVLPEMFSGDPERMARFEREAKLLASLNHPPFVPAILFALLEFPRFPESADFIRTGGQGLLPRAQFARRRSKRQPTPRSDAQFGRQHPADGEHGIDGFIQRNRIQVAAHGQVGAYESARRGDRIARMAGNFHYPLDEVAH